MKIDASFDPG